MKTFDISQAQAALDELTSLLDISFGPGRFARTAERLRENNQAVADYAHAARTGAGVFPFAPSARVPVMMSSIGSARVAPHPRRNVRRERRCFFRIMASNVPDFPDWIYGRTSGSWQSQPPRWKSGRDPP